MSKIAAIQMCSSAIVNENLTTAHSLIERAALSGAKLIVLPEMFSIMGVKDTDKIAVKETLGSGAVQEFLSHMAKSYSVWIVGGTIPIATKSPHHISASCLVYDDTGRLAARYDKIHLFDAIVTETQIYKESDTTRCGNQIVVVDTPVGKLGLSVCYDLRFPGLFTQLRRAGAEIIAVPSAFTQATGHAHWDSLTRCRAIENAVYLIAADQGGLHANNRETYGHTRIVDPWGTIMSEVTTPGSGLIVESIDLQALRKIRACFPISEHERPDLY